MLKSDQIELLLKTAAEANLDGAAEAILGVQRDQQALESLQSDYAASIEAWNKKEEQYKDKLAEATRTMGSLIAQIGLPAKETPQAIDPQASYDLYQQSRRRF